MINAEKSNKMKTNKDLSRRKFIKKTAASGIALNIVPAYVLGGSGRISPNDKLNIALIGCGTQGLRMLNGWLKRSELQFVSVCDPNTESRDYPQWGKSRGETHGAEGGREVGRRRINDFYAEQKGKSNFNGCTVYADFRELLEKAKELDAVFILTPDHLHATIALAAMKKNIKVATHKPISNFMYETRLACDYAKKNKVPTHCFAFQDPSELYTIQEWIKQRVIGKVKELHRWTNRPVWPQGSPYLPKEAPIPEGFDWQLWLGPSTERPYSPDYTHTVFRGWYEFGGGCLADMGYYGFWKDWRVLNLGLPIMADANASFTCEIKEFRSHKVRNNLSYPHAATIHWEVPVKGTDERTDVFWYEGGIRPRTPEALVKGKEQMPKEGVMFVGEKGILFASYGYRNPRLLGVKEPDKIIASINVPSVKKVDETGEMISSFLGGKSSRGDFGHVQTVAEMICLGNMAIRMDQRLEWDPKTLNVTNVPEANQYVKRNYRKGWEL